MQNYLRDNVFHRERVTACATVIEVFPEPAAAARRFDYPKRTTALSLLCGQGGPFNPVKELPHPKERPSKASLDDAVSDLFGRTPHMVTASWTSLDAA